MNIRWNNLFIVITGLIIGLVVLHHRTECGAALQPLTTILPHSGDNQVDDRFVGFMVLGLMAVTLVVIVKLIVNGRAGRRHDDRHDRHEDNHPQ